MYRVALMISGGGSSMAVCRSEDRVVANDDDDGGYGRTTITASEHGCGNLLGWKGDARREGFYRPGRFVPGLDFGRGTTMMRAAARPGGGGRRRPSLSLFSAREEAGMPPRRPYE